jgi:DNA-binding transcriptional ArsR family regulator
MLREPKPHIAAIFFALGDETRLSVLGKLSAGPLSATALSDGAGMTRQAIVKHLQVLDGAGLVAHEKYGREVLYTLDARRLDDASAFLEMISAGWDSAIDSLRHMVEEQSHAKPRTPRRRKRRR